MDIENTTAGAQGRSDVPGYYHACRLGSATITVFINHASGGGNTLFLDGHFAFERYPRVIPIPMCGLNCDSLTHFCQ